MLASELPKHVSEQGTPGGAAAARLPPYAPPGPASARPSRHQWQIATVQQLPAGVQGTCGSTVKAAVVGKGSHIRAAAHAHLGSAKQMRCGVGKQAGTHTRAGACLMGRPGSFAA